LFSDQFRRGEEDKSKLAGVKSSRLISGLSDIAWKAFQSVNQRLPEGEAIRPNWAPGPLLKSYERSAPPLGFPRETDSLCPGCVKEVRNAVISGEVPLDIVERSIRFAQLVQFARRVRTETDWPTFRERSARFSVAN